MRSRGGTSRRKFEEYRRRLRASRGSQEEQDVPAGPHGRPGKSTRRSRSFLALLREFLRLIRGQRWAIVAALAALSISTLLKLVPPAGTKLAIDYILPGKPLPEELTRLFRLPTDSVALLWLLAGSVLAMSLFNTFIHLWSRWQATRATKRVQMAVRRKVFEHAVRLPLHRVYQLKSGGVASILREDAGSVAELIFSLIYNPWRAVIQLLGSLAVLAWVDWRLLLGSLLLIPAVFLTHRTWINRIRPIFRDVRKQRQEIDGQATEAFGGMRVVRAFGRERSEAARFTRGNHLMGRQELLAWCWSRVIEIVWEVLIPLSSAALLVYGGARVLAGTLSLGDVMMFLIYLVMLLGPLATLAESATALQNSLAGLDRVLDLLAEDREMEPDSDAVMLRAADVRGRIHLRQVDFAYPGGKDRVLHGIELDVRPGQMVALVGPSGAGKTTLCNLVARFYDPSTGSIELDGVDLRKIDVDSYRRLLGIVEQDVFLFDGTVAENIGYAARHAGEEDVVAAAQAAHAHEFITALPAGYDTLIGERGVRLSGGQRQRLAIARAILADPRILILDEATSNLDTESEQLIQQSLAVLMRGRTSLVIAHRLSTIRHADQIVVLEGGRIVETGTHAELLAASGRYRRMVQIQLGPIAGEELMAEGQVT